MFQNLNSLILKEKVQVGNDQEKAQSEMLSLKYA